MRVTRYTLEKQKDEYRKGLRNTTGIFYSRYSNLCHFRESQ